MSNDLRKHLEMVRDEKCIAIIGDKDDGFKLGFDAAVSELLPMIEDYREALEFYAGFSDEHRVYDSISKMARAALEKWGKK